MRRTPTNRVTAVIGLTLGFLLTVIVVTGCQPKAEPSTTSTAKAKSSEGHGSAGSGHRAPTDALVEYERTGGVAGFSDHVHILSDRSGQYSDRTHADPFVLEEKEFADMKAALESAEPADAPVKKDHPDALFTFMKYQGNYIQAPKSVLELMQRIIKEGKESPSNQTDSGSGGKPVGDDGAQ